MIAREVSISGVARPRPCNLKESDTKDSCEFKERSGLASVNSRRRRSKVTLEGKNGLILEVRLESGESEAGAKVA
jgi:hypothetical protein